MTLDVWGCGDITWKMETYPAVQSIVAWLVVLLLAFVFKLCPFLTDGFKILVRRVSDRRPRTSV